MRDFVDIVVVIFVEFVVRLRPTCNSLRGAFRMICVLLGVSIYPYRNSRIVVRQLGSLINIRRRVLDVGKYNA